MSKIKYYLFSGIFALAMTTVGAGLAYANVDINGNNDTTGPNSENENQWDINNRSEFEVENTAEAENNPQIDVNAGENEIGNNTEVDDVRTGDICGEVVVSNALNSEMMAMVGESSDINVELGNFLTGPSSENENEVDIDNSSDIDISNRAEVDNDLDIDANTGRNEISHNTVVGDVRTGSIRVDASVDNQLNQNMDMGEMNFCQNCQNEVNASFSNDTTGPNSENENQLDIDNSSDVDVTNSADIDNNIDLDANTGENEIGCNTVVGDIETGSIDFSTVITNTAN